MQNQGRALRALARSILRSSHDADDVVQDTFAAELAQGPAKHNRHGWLRRVAQNLARRRLRDLKRRRQHEANLPVPPPVTATDDVLQQVEAHRLVADAVLQLGEPYRRAIVLRYWHDLPPRAIAKQLSLPVATVKTNLQRGLAELQKRLDHNTGNRRAWLAALVPIVHPQLRTGVLAGSPFAATTAAAFVIMNTKHLLFTLIACLCVGMLAWQPWTASVQPVAESQTIATVEPAHASDSGRPRSQADDKVEVAASKLPESVVRELVEPAERMVTIIGRVVTTGDLPAANARIRLARRWEDAQAPERSVTTSPDGSFAVTVPRPNRWIRYHFVLADAPGWAVRELLLEAKWQNSIADGRLDLGTICLERGVAVAGLVVRADGAPLRTRARLLLWDPARRGSWSAMDRGRTVGFTESDGRFSLTARTSAGKNGSLILAAVSESGVGWATLAFAAGQEQLDPVEIRMLPDGGIDVQVVDAAGAPIAGAQLHATPYFQPIGLAPMWQPSAAGSYTPPIAEVRALFLRQSDQSGHAHFINLPRRQHPSIRDANTNQRTTRAIIICAKKDDYGLGWTTVDPVADGTAEVTITLTKLRRVAFYGVVATADGKRLPGVTVKGGNRSSVTDAEGRYELPESAFRGTSTWFQIAGGDVPMTRFTADIPSTGERIEHNFTVEFRAPVTGMVVDQFGTPVAGVKLYLGIKDGMQYRSTPEQTGDDGRFAFPDAVASQDDLWVRPPSPLSAWQLERARALTRRDGEVVTLHRLQGALVDLAIAIVDGQTGSLVSPTEVEIQRLHGTSENYNSYNLQVELTFGSASAKQLPPGRYRATARAAGGLQGEQTFTVLANAATHAEKVELWPTTAVVCTLDTSALPPAEQPALSGNLLVTLEPQSEQSYLVDAHGKRMNYTPNTGMFRIGSTMSFRLERVSTNVPLRLRIVGAERFGEAWFRAEPGRDTEVSLRLAPFGRLAFEAPAGWPAGKIELDAHDGGVWRPIQNWDHNDVAAHDEQPVRRPAGEVRWRLRLWPKHDGEMLERSGTATVVAGATTKIVLE